MMPTKRPTKEVLEDKYLKNKVSTYGLAKEYGVSQKTTLTWLTQYGIPRRSIKDNVPPVAKGSHHTWGKKIGQSMMGEKNHRWRGKDATYFSKHEWIRVHYGNPSYCEHCKRTDRGKYEWANISGEYLREPGDWLRLCVSCHRKYDRRK